MLVCVYVQFTPRWPPCGTERVARVVGSPSSLIQEAEGCRCFPKRRQGAAARWGGPDDSRAAGGRAAQGEAHWVPQSTWAVEVVLRAGQPPLSLWVLKLGSSSPLPPSVVGCLGPGVVTSAQLQAWFSFLPRASNASFPPLPRPSHFFT